MVPKKYFSRNDVNNSFDIAFNFTNLAFLETLHTNLSLVFINVSRRPSLGLKQRKSVSLTFL